MVFRDRLPANATPKISPQGEQLQIGIRYRMMQNLATSDDAVIVQTDEGRSAFQIESARRDMMDMLVLRDMSGRDCCLLPRDPALATEILGADGHPLAWITRTPVSPVRDRFEIDIVPSGSWLAIGDVGSHEFTIESPNGQIAEVSRRWFLRPGTYGVEVAPGQNDALVLSVAATIDFLAHGLNF